MKPVKLGLLGLGTVGGGTANVLERNKDEISRRCGHAITIKSAATRTLDKKRDCNTDNIELTDDPFVIVNDPDVDIVVELMGGTELAKELVLAAIENGKHVVTANKALIAEFGNDIFEKAKDKQVVVAYEAAVAGGIPIIKAIREGLGGNRIEYVAGIINGTGNFILSEMFEKGRPFADVLAEAQQLGYAEADPTFDVEGIDAAHKLTILASIAFGIPLSLSKTFTEGISNITTLDMHYANELGYRIKHLAIAQRSADGSDDGVELRVHPALIKVDRLIAQVNGVMNAVLVYADAVGPTMYYGAGAGAEPTASAVVADIVDIVRTMDGPAENRVSGLGFHADAMDTTPVKSMQDTRSAFYLRMDVADEVGVLSDITTIMSQRGISLEAVLQKRESEEGVDADVNSETVGRVPLVMLTHVTLERNMQEAIGRIEKLPAVQGKIHLIRVADIA